MTMEFETLRPLLYYPLGLLPTIFFTLRVVIQWLQSEKKKQSYSGPLFWKLSLAGNLLLALHYTVQVQFPFALIQGVNAVVSWRNLDLLNTKKPYSTAQSLGVLTCSLATVTLLFLLQSFLLIGELDWIRTPVKLFDHNREHHHIAWHLFGTLGSGLFASRFWVQWWQAERSKRSELGASFWWLSIIGSTMSLVYFLHIGDTVSITLHSFGLIPYARNLVLMRRSRKAVA